MTSAQKALQKTCLCKFYSVGMCQRGDLCHYAHCIEELRKIPKGLWKNRQAGTSKEQLELRSLYQGAEGQERHNRKRRMQDLEEELLANKRRRDEEEEAFHQHRMDWLMKQQQKVEEAESLDYMLMNRRLQDPA